MSTEHNGSLLTLELPLMYVEPRRTLVELYASAGELSALDGLRHGVEQAGGSVKSAYAYYQPERGKFLALLTVDATDAASDLKEKLGAVPGVDLLQKAPTEGSLVAAECNTLQVAGTPMVVMAKEVLGGAFQSLAQASQSGAVYEAGLRMGKLAASAVPPLLDRLGVPLTLELLERRLADFQVFGWAEVRKVDVSESLQGTIELSSTFESAPWKGKASQPTCDFIRGFTTGVFSLAYNRDFTSDETACQSKGDPVCRISFRPAA